jgi:hypothetical protein
MLIERAGVFTTIGFSIYSMVNRKNRALNAVRMHRPRPVGRGFAA